MRGYGTNARKLAPPFYFWGKRDNTYTMLHEQEERVSIEGLPEGLREKLDTRIFAEGRGCLEGVPDIIARVRGAAGGPVLLVCDENTRRAAGEKTGGFLTGAGIEWGELLLEPGGYGMVAPDYERAAEIRDAILAKGCFPLAVGSGCINDLVKRAAFEAKTPYVCVGTASSMDGYCSFGAALVYEGFKTTMPCTPPAAIVADTDVLGNAPYDMTASGYGDLYAKLPAGVDWLLADRLGIEGIHGVSWDLVQRDLRSWVGCPEKLRAGDMGAFSDLFRGLSMTGIAMQVYQDSRPASGAEHLVSHVWEMEHLSGPDGVPWSHGFKVAVGTVASASLMEAFFEAGASLTVEGCLKRRESWEERLAGIDRFFPNPKIRRSVEEACKAKWLDDGALAARLERLIPLIPELKGFFAERVGGTDKVRGDFKKAGCPVSAADFGLGKGALKEAVLKAQMIRKRYTILDGVYETGLLGELLEGIE
jgi:glycerol-1-phosphate dehydrogenase [NAD(P)+]